MGQKREEGRFWPVKSKQDEKRGSCEGVPREQRPEGGREGESEREKAGTAQPVQIPHSKGILGTFLHI